MRCFFIYKLKDFSLTLTDQGGTFSLSQDMLNFYTVHQIILVIWLKLTYQALTAYTFTVITND